VISVDTKKKELVGDFKNAGRELRPKSSPIEVRTHDFSRQTSSARRSPTVSTTSPRTRASSTSGSTPTPPSSRSASIRAWWDQLGRERYPDARTLTITADCGGSNGNRTRLWKTELQRLADETGLELTVCHFRPAPRVEQDRTPPVQFHLTKLARQAAHQPRGDHQPDRGDNNTHRPRSLRFASTSRSYPKDLKVSATGTRGRQNSRATPSTQSGTTRSNHDLIVDDPLEAVS